MQASDVRFASVMADFNGASAAESSQTTPDNRAGSWMWGSRWGAWWGRWTHGRGRGTATVGGGRVLNYPLLVPLIRLTNLELPIEEKLDYAYTDFFLSGRRMTLNDVSILSKSVWVFGYGVATLPEMTLDLRCGPRRGRGSRW